MAIEWARANRAALGLTAADVDALRLDYRQMTHSTGITHLRYRQAYRGIPAFDNGLRVNLDRAGRILNVTGSPVSGLRVGSIVPQLDAAAALRALQRNVGVRARGQGHVALLRRPSRDALRRGLRAARAVHAAPRARGSRGT